MFANAFVRTLENEKDYSFDVKTKNVMLTEDGITKAEKAFHIENLFDLKHVALLHHINQGFVHTLLCIVIQIMLYKKAKL